VLHDWPERHVKVVFEKESSILREILFRESESLAASLDVVGRPLLLHNLAKITASHPEAKEFLLPEGFPQTVAMAQEGFPSLDFSEYAEVPNGDAMRVPMDSLALGGATGGVRFERLMYPWDLLLHLQELLSSEVTETTVSKDASVAETAVLKGPCRLGAGVSIDDFCKVKGPIYIGPRTKVGTGSLVRNSSIGRDSEVGFNAEVAKSFLAAEDVVPHLDLILDSVLGEDIWMGGFVGTVNVLFTYKNVRCMADGQLVDSGLNHLGVIAGHGVRIGAATMTMPGRYLPPGSVTVVNSTHSESGDVVRSSRNAPAPPRPPPRK
jgi:bifunctional UDP-N-acetylglucosamine pyrophosphorylase/glucosamine-1-phosphate N-acetyltransferase